MKINSLQLGLFFTITLLLLLGGYYQDLSVFITFFFLLYLGKLLLKKQVHTIYKLQRNSFFVNVCSGVLITTWYSSGQDDFTFYSISTFLSKGQYNFNIADRYFEWSSIQYKFYVLAFAYWYKMLNIIGVSSNFFFHLNIINSFVASFIAPFVYKIGLKVFGDKSSTPKIAALFCLLFPILIYYSSVIIRDSWIITFFLMIVYALISNKTLLRKLLLIFVLLFLVFFLRKSSAVFIVALILLYIVFNTKNAFFVFLINRIVPFVTLFILLIFFIAIQLPVPEVAPPNTEVLNYISYTVNFYRNLSASEAVDSSVGLQLRLSNNPIVIFVYYVYFYLSPVPPVFIKNFNIVNVFLGVGNILWYIVSPLYFIHSFQLRKTSNIVFIKSFFWFLILVLIMVGTATGEQRHLLFLYPIVFLFSIDYVLNHKQQFYTYLMSFFFIGIFSVLIYILLKMII